MNAKIIRLSVFAIALAVLFGLGAVNNTFAAHSDSFNVSPADQANLIGVDEANNGVGAASDRDSGPSPSFQTYGLSGDWSLVR